MTEEEAKALVYKDYFKSSKQQQAIELYVKSLLDSEHNLISPLDKEQVWSRHILDCAQLERFFPDKEQGKYLDVGSGGGLPGIVLSILKPSFECYLLEATQKKADFLTNVSRETGKILNKNKNQVVCKRIGANHSPFVLLDFDIITFRAVAPPIKILTWINANIPANSVNKEENNDNETLFIIPQGKTWKNNLDRLTRSFKLWNNRFNISYKDSVSSDESKIFLIKQKQKNG